MEGGAIKQIVGDRGDPVKEGAICLRGLASVQVLYHLDRLKTPLVRAGERGEGKWREVPWDDALNMIADRLDSIKKESGPEAVVLARGTNRRSWIRVFNRFADVFGTPNWTSILEAQEQVSLESIS